MAEIHVERKTKKPVWPWVILLVLILMALGWWLFEGTSDEQIPEGVEINSIEQNETAKALAYDTNTEFFFEHQA